MLPFAAHLNHYDVHQFHRIAHESCNHIEQVSHQVLQKSNQLLKRFQWRLGGFILILSLITGFTMCLYLNNEFPWEIHDHAVNERQAGKMLIQAWPKLNLKEKTKIITSTGLTHEP